MRESTSKFILFSVLCLIWTLVLYLSFAFIAWQPNPGEWDLAGRFMSVVFWGVGVAVAVGVAVEVK